MQTSLNVFEKMSVFEFPPQSTGVAITSYSVDVGRRKFTSLWRAREGKGKFQWFVVCESDRHVPLADVFSHASALKS